MKHIYEIEHRSVWIVYVDSESQPAYRIPS